MRYLSLFSGIEAASVAWLPLGWECVGVAEIEKFPCELLKHHYPDVPNLGDITKITQAQIESLGHVDLVVGGFPCQDLSVVGKRKGLIDENGNFTRSGLFYTAMQIARWSKCRYLLLENVPGIYSSNSGLDFTAMVGEILNAKFPTARKKWQNSGMACTRTGLLEWRTFDAQYFGVPQRRRRMFALADFGNWTSRPPILFEQHSLQGYPAPSREKRQEVAGIAGTLTSNGGGLNRPAGNANELDFCIASYTPSSFGNYSEGVGTLKKSGGDLGGGSETLCIPINTMTMMGRPSDDLNPRMGLGIGKHGEPQNTLTKTHSHAVAYGVSEKPDIGHCLRSNASKADKHESSTYILQSMHGRRLTPLECERLQGFPDNYTKISDKTPDTARYKALGNSMAVPVMRWIGQQIQKKTDNK